MHPIPLIRASQLKPFKDYLKGIGSPVERLMTLSGLPALVVDDPEALISYYSLGKFVETAARLEGIEDFGLRVAQASSVEDIGAFWAYIVQAPTLYAALERLIKMVRAYSSGSRFWLNEQSDEVWFCRQGFKHMPSGQRHDEYYTLILMVNIVRLAAGHHWWPHIIRLQMDTTIPEGLKQEASTDTDFKIGEEITAFPIPRPLLALPMKGGVLGNSDSVSDQQAHAALCDMPENFAQSLHLALTPYLGEYHPDIHLAADITGLSVRTLQRHLSRWGLTYRELVDQIRFQAAMRLIVDDSIMLSDIARHVGYSDSAHFNRAFRRWTGNSPSEYRSHRLSDGSD